MLDIFTTFLNGTVKTVPFFLDSGKSVAELIRPWTR
jgi:hypothetical protein